MGWRLLATSLVSDHSIASGRKSCLSVQHDNFIVRNRRESDFHAHSSCSRSIYAQPAITATTVKIMRIETAAKRTAVTLGRRNVWIAFTPHPQLIRAVHLNEIWRKLSGLKG